jgi:hypothetical protein
MFKKIILLSAILNLKHLAYAICLLPLSSIAMEQPPTPLSKTEESFLQNVLKIWQRYDFNSIEEKERKLECIQHHAMYCDSFKEWEKRNLEGLKEQKARYEQFFIWRESSATQKLRDAKFLYSKMAAENNVEGMQAIETLALEWQLISDPNQKLEKLDYHNALQEAVNHGGSAATRYLLEKKNVSPKKLPVNPLLKICNGAWGKNSYSCSFGGGETLHKNIVQLLIKKGAPSSIADIRTYLCMARTTNAPARLIKYLEEVEATRRNS